MRTLRRFQERISYQFQDEKLLLRAVTHPSYTFEHEGDEDAAHNQTLEFLGDAVVDLIASRMLLDARPDAREGELSRRRSAIVNEASLARIGEDLGIPNVLRLGRNDKRLGVAHKQSVVADAVEAIIGAIFLDAGYDAAEATVRPWLTELGDELARGDPKSRLQEWSQKKHGDVPEYVIEQEDGPPHERTYSVSVTVGGQTVGHGVARSKKEAEQQAAWEALMELENA